MTAKGRISNSFAAYEVAWLAKLMNALAARDNVELSKLTQSRVFRRMSQRIHTLQSRVELELPPRPTQAIPEATIQALKAAAATESNRSHLAKRFGVSRTAVSRILSGKLRTTPRDAWRWNKPETTQQSDEVSV